LTRLIISLLGPFLVTLDGQRLTGFDYDKVRALLAYLALEARRPHRREALAGLLWPEQPEKAAHAGLRNALAALRRTIGDEAADPPYLFITREAIQFNIDSDHALDAADFPRLLDHAARHRHRAPAACRVCAGWRREAADLYHGPLLSQFSLAGSPEFEGWLTAHRENLHVAAMETFAWLADFYLQRGDYQTARYFAGRQLAYEPWREPAHRQAMRALGRSGERTAALKQYETCRQVLADELGVSPEPETRLLYERIRDGNLTIKAAPRLVSPAINPLIGRERDLAELGKRLADPDVRLVTITGPGGVGKTSLALAAGHQFGPDFGDGSVFVSLQTAEDPGGIFPAIAAALGLDPEPGHRVEDQLAEYLWTRELLLVLDNFDHLIDGANRLVSLLAATPEVVLLVTSRQRLGLTIEWLYELAGLDYPKQEAAAPLAGYGALQLFARRARQERGDFALMSAEAIAAADICRLVQGMPLAIELAAAATGVQSTVEIAQRLQAGLDALAAEWADLPPRHRSIRAAFEHSWTMLTGDERRILRRLSVFRGGFDGEAAGTVAGATLGDLRRLRDKSLLQVGEAGRYDLHPLIRAYAAERLAQRGENEEATRAHLAYFMGMAEAGEQALKGPDQLVWVRRLEADHANILAVLNRAEGDDYAIAARVAAAMWLFWFMRAHLMESRRRYERLYPEREVLPARLRARLLNGYTSALMGQGDFGAINPIGQEALVCYLEVADDEGIALSYHHLAIAARMRGDLEASETLARAGIIAARRTTDTGFSWELTIAMDTLSSTLTHMGRLEEAETLARESADLAQAYGDRWGWAYHLLKLAIIDLNEGQLERARGPLEQVLAVAEEHGDRRLIAAASTYLGEIAVRQWDLAEAWKRAETAEQQYREVGDRTARAEALEMLGDIFIRRGFPAEAALRYREARDVYMAAGNEAGVRKAEEKLVEVARGQD
jgi:predicted ATPase/DNA-binding SARP family transcriptional activator/predicted negative regulator of RcsB-dependent stress response